MKPQIIVVPSTDYIKIETIKKMVVLHYTAGMFPGYEASLNIRDYVNVHYSIRRNGQIRSYFAEKYYSYHTGTTKKHAMESIGIEIECWGHLDRIGNALKTWTGKTVPWTEVVKCEEFRNYIYWHSLTPEQYAALDWLLPDIRTRNPIKIQTTHAVLNQYKLDFPPSYPGMDKYMMGKVM